MKTRAAVLNRVQTPLAVETLELAPPRAGEVLVRLAAAGVCHSDLHVIHGTIEKELPIVLGHEGAGRVVEVGPGVTLVRPGDPVVLSWAPDCGHCRYCVAGRPSLCDHRQPFSNGTLADGTTRLSRAGEPVRQFTGLGCFSEYAVVSERAAIPIRPEIPLDRAALIGCAVLTGVGAVLFTARAEPGCTVAVFGVGGVGLNVVQGATLVNAARIFAVDTQPRKLEFARRLGATDPILAADGDPVREILARTGGRGVDYAFEAIGLPQTMAQAFACLAKGGTAVAIGVAPTEALVAVPARALVYGERVLRGSFYGSARPRTDFGRMVDLYLAGRLRLDDLVTRTYTLEEIDTAFDHLAGGELARGLIRFEA